MKLLKKLYKQWLSKTNKGHYKDGSNIPDDILYRGIILLVSILISFILTIVFLNPVEKIRYKRKQNV